MATVTAAMLEADIAGLQVKIVMHDEDFVWKNLIKVGERKDGASGGVHVRGRLKQP